MPRPFVHLTRHLRDHGVPLGPWSTGWYSATGDERAVRLHLLDHHEGSTHTRGPAPEDKYVIPCLDCLLAAESHPTQLLWAQGLWVVAVLLQRLEEFRQLANEHAAEGPWTWLLRLDHSLHRFSTSPQCLTAGQLSFTAEYPELFGPRALVRPGSDLALLLEHVDSLVELTRTTASELPAAATAWAALADIADGPPTHMAFPAAWARTDESRPAEAAAHVWAIAATPVAHDQRWFIVPVPGSIPRAHVPHGIPLDVPAGTDPVSVQHTLSLWGASETMTAESFGRLLEAVCAASAPLANTTIVQEGHRPALPHKAEAAR